MDPPALSIYPSHFCRENTDIFMDQEIMQGKNIHLLLAISTLLRQATSHENTPYA
jgi:hypothetical protein